MTPPMYLKNLAMNLWVTNLQLIVKNHVHNVELDHQALKFPQVLSNTPTIIVFWIYNRQIKVACYALSFKKEKTQQKITLSFL